MGCAVSNEDVFRWQAIETERDCIDIDGIVQSLKEAGLYGIQHELYLALVKSMERKRFLKNESVIQFPYNRPSSSMPADDIIVNYKYPFTSARFDAEYLYYIMSGECCSEYFQYGNNGATNNDHEDSQVYHDRGSIIGCKELLHHLPRDYNLRCSSDKADILRLSREAYEKITGVNRTAEETKNSNDSDSLPNTKQQLLSLAIPQNCSDKVVATTRKHVQFAADIEGSSTATTPTSVCTSRGTTPRSTMTTPKKTVRSYFDKVVTIDSSDFRSPRSQGSNTKSPISIYERHLLSPIQSKMSPGPETIMRNANAKVNAMDSLKHFKFMLESLTKSESKTPTIDNMNDAINSRFTVMKQESYKEYPTSYMQSNGSFQLYGVNPMTKKNVKEIVEEEKDLLSYVHLGFGSFLETEFDKEFEDDLSVAMTTSDSLDEHPCIDFVECE